VRTKPQKEAIISTALPPQEAETIRAIAESAERSVSAQVRFWLRPHIAAAASETEPSTQEPA